MDWIRERWRIVRNIFERRWVKIGVAVWAVVGTYDTFISQFVPESWAQKFPKMHEIIAATSGWLPLWGWLLILAGIIIAALLEYAVRKSRSHSRLAAAGASNATLPSDMVPAADALNVIIKHFEPKWGEERSPGTHIQMAAHRLREAASRGLVEIEGRQEINRHHPIGERFSSIWRPIGKDFWLTHEFDLVVVLDETARWQACETRPEHPQDMTAASQPGYAGLRISRAKVRATWPLSQKVPLVEAAPRERPRRAELAKPEPARVVVTLDPKEKARRLIIVNDLYGVMNGPVHDSLEYAQGILGSMQGIVRDHYISGFLDSLNECRLKFATAFDQLRASIKTNELYTEIYGDLTRFKQDELWEAFNELLRVLRALDGESRPKWETLSILTDPQKKALLAQFEKMQRWIEDSKAGLLAKRQAYLRGVDA
jgi:hypothetical protein